jgi:lambda family phage tail tape measure protein
LQAEAEYAEKLKQFWLKRYMEQAEIRAQYQQDEIDYMNAKGKAMEQSNQAAQDATKNLDNQKKLLELKYQMIYATEQEQKLAEISLKYSLLRQENEGKENEKFLNLQLDRQEAIEKFNVSIQESTKRTQQVFESVYGNLSSAIDNFVKTGKLNMKDLARSIIQDLIAIQMKAAAMRFLGAAFSMFAPSVGANGASGLGTGVQGFGSAYADGGDPTPNTINLVGERGPELFVPRTAGTIIPNNDLKNMGSTTNVTNNYINAIDTKSFEDRLLGSSNAIWAANQYANKSLAVNRGRA